ncbi:peptidylprolyl isomerase [Loktanella sp. D2R18]|uniref:peptidylprolyl isomerase n=1 Tax=Rhodobacterales TaxID=204455 RepID=UPI000DEA4730|nr:MULTISPECIES: peptidylprolyl isomerase [Rhodobacterales]MDO6589626.1 peptidylprolyl isomerase [Yoonia sp. 1_MG-2023]RBW44261.1 peptidylprolyl isomerase [Loktanella sp. D2R18]
MRLFTYFAVILAWALTSSSAALAQGQLTPVITVNDKVVTRYELNQRMRLLELFRTPGDLNEVAREGLIEDRLKQQEMDRVGLQLDPASLETALNDFAARANMTLPQFTNVLAQNNVDVETLRDFVAVGVAWRDYVRARYSREVTITDADIERALQAQGTQPTQIEVLLSEIIIAPPPDRQVQAAQAAREISQMRSYAEFEAAARQVSALPSRENGGRLGWLPISNYPPQLQQILLDLAPGEVTEPIEIPNAIALFQKRGMREAPRALQAPVSIDYAAYYIPGGQSDAARNTAADVKNSVDTCDDLYGIARNQPAEVLDRLVVAPSEISSDVALELARLDPGEVSYNLTRDNGETLVFLMMCARNQAGSDTIDPAAVRNQLTSQRLAGLADALVADLRASAVITSR